MDPKIHTGMPDFKPVWLGGKNSDNISKEKLLFQQLVASFYPKE